MALAEYGNAFNIDTGANGDPILIDAQSGQTVATYDRTQSAWVYGDIISDSVNTGSITNKATRDDDPRTVIDNFEFVDVDSFSVDVDVIADSKTLVIIEVHEYTVSGSNTPLEFEISSLGTGDYDYSQESATLATKTVTGADEFELISPDSGTVTDVHSARFSLGFPRSRFGMSAVDSHPASRFTGHYLEKGCGPAGQATSGTPTITLSADAGGAEDVRFRASVIVSSDREEQIA